MKSKGTLKLSIYKKEKLIKILEEPNMIITQGKSNFTRLIGGHPTGEPITQIGFGTNGLAATEADTSLTDPYIRPIDSLTFPDDKSVSFQFELTYAEANGKEIREFGLFTPGNKLCARKVRVEPIEKTADVRLVGNWKLTIN